MEKGTIRSYEKNSGGMIGRLGNMDVQFLSQSVLGKDRSYLKQGDSVWFEVDNVQNVHMAINIRKC